MKILLVSDIHSNWPALKAVTEAEPDFDACLCAGDIVDYATEPVPCVDWIRRHATICVRGNHDHAVAQRVVPQGGPGFRGLARATRPMHWEALDEERLTWLETLPVTAYVTLDGLQFFLVHGTPRDPLDEYLIDDARQWEDRLQHVDADIVCVGHTHQPFELQLSNKRVINPGSVGQPRDGNPRASYAVIERGRVEFRRVEYDIRETLDALERVGIAAETIAFAEEVLLQGGR